MHEITATATVSAAARRARIVDLMEVSSSRPSQ
jgi:hypothetical protein